MTTYILIITDNDGPEPKAPTPESSPPIDVATRRALFASLRDAYGRDLSDAERLDKVSTLAGRTITSMSSYGNMTMADAHRVLDILHTF